MKPVTPLCIASPRICCWCHMEGFPSPNISMETTPLKNTLAGEVVSLLSQDHRLPAFWCRHMIWPTICQLRLENWGLKPWGDLCRTLFPRVPPQSSALTWGFSSWCSRVLLVFSWRRRAPFSALGTADIPDGFPSGWVSFHHLFCVQYKQYYFLDVPSY